MKPCGNTSWTPRYPGNSPFATWNRRFRHSAAYRAVLRIAKRPRFRFAAFSHMEYAAKRADRPCRICREGPRGCRFASPVPTGTQFAPMDTGSKPARKRNNRIQAAGPTRVACPSRSMVKLRQILSPFSFHVGMRFEDADASRHLQIRHQGEIAKCPHRPTQPASKP